MFNLDSHWYAVKQLGKDIGYYISSVLESLFKLVKKNCRLIKDTKVPVSVSLLQLCRAADGPFFFWPSPSACAFPNILTVLAKAICLIIFTLMPLTRLLA